MNEKPTYDELEKRIKKLEQAEVEQKRTEEELRTSEEDYRSTLNNLRVGVVIHASDTSIQLSNPEAENILGLTREQMSGDRKSVV